MQAPGHTTELPTKKTLGLVIVNVGHRWQGKLARAGDLSTPAAFSFFRIQVQNNHTTTSTSSRLLAARRLLSNVQRRPGHWLIGHVRVRFVLPALSPKKLCQPSEVMRAEKRKKNRMVLNMHASMACHPSIKPPRATWS